jgi:hypothetical protein
MKKIFLTFLIFSAALTCAMAQSDTLAGTDSVRVQHLKYEGIEIDGTVTDYMHNLNALGYKNIGIEKGVGILSANIMGCRNAIVNVASSHANTSVYAVSVCYTFAQKAEDLESKYVAIIDTLTAHYGPPVTEEEENFQDFIYPGYENGWRNTKLIKSCKFETEEGYIKIAIFQRNIYTLNIVYADNLNYAKAKQERGSK